MKILKASLVCLLLCMGVAYNAGAQNQHPPISEPDYNKPKLFSDLPDSLGLNTDVLGRLFELPANSPVSFPLAQKFHFQGTVVSKSEEPGAPFQSIVLRSSNRLGAVLTVSRMVSEEKTVHYTGNILSRKHSDAYELTGEANNYYFIKKGFYDLSNE